MDELTCTPVEPFVEEIVGIARTAVGDAFSGAYIIGSLASGDFVPATSDIDLAIVVNGSLPLHVRRSLALQVIDRLPRCPTRGLELVVYSKAGLRRPGARIAFEMNLTGGPRMPVRVSYDPRSEPSHWYVIDVAMARSGAVALAGPPPASVFPRVSRNHLYEAILASLDWYEAEGRDDWSALLTACRAWRFATEAVWSSKAAAAEWARERLEDPTPVEAALQLRRGDQRGALAAEQVRAVIARARSAIDEALRRERRTRRSAS